MTEKEVLMISLKAASKRRAKLSREIEKLDREIRSLQRALEQNWVESTKQALNIKGE